MHVGVHAGVEPGAQGVADFALDRREAHVVEAEGREALAKVGLLLWVLDQWTEVLQVIAEDAE
jgi:hypothetical protein